LAALYGLADNVSPKLLQKPITTGNPPKLLSGGGGLFSTASDYLRFAQMLLNKGELNGNRILGSKTVQFMSKNHLSNELEPIHPGLPGKCFGLGFAILIDDPQSYSIGSKGEFEWRGINNTFFWVAPKEELVLILMTQFSPYLYYPINKEFKVLVYQAIIG